MSLERFKNVKPYVPGKPIEEVKRQLGLKTVFKLASNENAWGPSPKVVAAIAEAAKDVNRYPDGGCFYLRRELAKRLTCGEDQLVFGNGSDEILMIALRVFCEPGDEIVIARPTFLMYGIIGESIGAVVKEVPLKNFRYDLDGMQKAVTKKTRVVIIGNPDNPAGTYVSQAQLDFFLKGLPPDIIVLLDEAYRDYVTAKDYPDSIPMLAQYKNLLVTRTFSKLYGLAGLRIGYGVVRPDVADIFNRVREPFNINSLGQVAALAALRDQAYYRRVAKAVEKGRQYLYAELRRLGLAFVESATNFILIDVSPRKGREVAQGLLKQGIIVRDMGGWGLDQNVRVTIGTDKENAAFIRALSKALATKS